MIYWKSPDGLNVSVGGLICFWDCVFVVLQVQTAFPKQEVEKTYGEYALPHLRIPVTTLIKPLWRFSTCCFRYLSLFISMFYIKFLPILALFLMQRTLLLIAESCIWGRRGQGGRSRSQLAQSMPWQDLTNEAWAEMSLLNLCHARRKKTKSKRRVKPKLFSAMRIR